MDQVRDLELSFLYLTPLPNALHNLTEFLDNSSKDIGVMGCTIMRLWTDRWMDGQIDSMLIAISPNLSVGGKQNATKGLEDIAI